MSGPLIRRKESAMLVFLVLLSRLHWSWPRTVGPHRIPGSDVTADPSSNRTALEVIFNDTLPVFSAAATVALSTDTSPQTFVTTQSGTSKTAKCPAKVAGGSVFLTVSSLAETSGSGSITERRLQLNWIDFKAGLLDRVALYDRDPSISSASVVPLDQARVVDHPEGSFTSYVAFPKPRFSASNLTSECLGFWIAYLKNGNKVVASNCIRAYPFWMSEMDLGFMNLTALMIPGTHDSGSYAPYLGKKSENVLTRYIYSQEETVFNQLAYGIRCLDLRIGFYNKTKEKFWINHSYFRTANTLATVLADIKSFLAATSEVVVLDIHRFPVGFDNNPAAHKLLVEYLEAELGTYLIPYEFGYGVRLKDLASSGKRLLAAYNSEERNSHPLLWPGIQQKWGDKQNADLLVSFFESVFQGGGVPTVLWSAMAELTPTSSDILLKPKRGLRILAEEVNRNLTLWFRNYWADDTNIVATDYCLGNNIIAVAIDNNRKKRCRNQ